MPVRSALGVCVQSVKHTHVWACGYHTILHKGSEVQGSRWQVQHTDNVPTYMSASCRGSRLKGLFPRQDVTRWCPGLRWAQVHNISFMTYGFWKFWFNTSSMILGFNDSFRWSVVQNPIQGLISQRPSGHKSEHCHSCIPHTHTQRTLSNRETTVNCW